MRLSRLQQYLLAPAFIAALFILTSPILSAQQVSYYDFDVPANTSVQDSYVCTSGTVVSMAAAGTLFCFNYSTGTGQSPDSLFLDLYQGRVRWMRDRTARALPLWPKDLPGYGAMLAYPNCY